MGYCYANRVSAKPTKLILELREVKRIRHSCFSYYY